MRVALCLKERINYIQLPWKCINEWIESFSVKIRGQETKENSWLVFTTGSPIKESLLMKCFHFYRKHHSSRL